MFKRLYERVLAWAKHRHAARYLFTLSFAESSFFPIPPDIMLAPMCLSAPKKGTWYAFLTTVGSVLGGIFGYLIGMFSFELIEPLIHTMGFVEKIELVKGWFQEWGFWAILIAGFSPIPYKVFTITAGLLGMVFLPFVLASIVGRGARFFLIAFLVQLGGDKLLNNLNQHIEKIGWVTALVTIGALMAYKLMGH